MALRLRRGFPEEERARVAELYWEAFGGKLGNVLSPRPKALQYLCQSLCPEHAIVALSAQDRVIGVVGFATHQGALVQGSQETMRPVYGRLGTAWRMHLLDLLMSPSEGAQFLMDGLFVAEEARGQGVGTALLYAFANEGRRLGYSAARLEVITSNLRARALYERHGWKAVAQDDIGWLRLIYGFRQTTAMTLKL